MLQACYAQLIRWTCDERGGFTKGRPRQRPVGTSEIMQTEILRSHTGHHARKTSARWSEETMDRWYCSVGRQEPGRNGKTGGEQKRLPEPPTLVHIGHVKLMLKRYSKCWTTFYLRSLLETRCLAFPENGASLPLSIFGLSDARSLWPQQFFLKSWPTMNCDLKWYLCMLMQVPRWLVSWWCPAPSRTQCGMQPPTIGSTICVELYRNQSSRGQWRQCPPLNFRLSENCWKNLRCKQWGWKPPHFG